MSDAAELMKLWLLCNIFLFYVSEEGAKSRSLQSCFFLILNLVKLCNIVYGLCKVVIFIHRGI